MINGVARLRFLAVVLVPGAILLSAAPAAAAVPNTSIQSGPPPHTTSRSATFRFAANLRRANFQCKLDGKAWSSCTSPKRYSRLGEGRHKFLVRARMAGAVDPSPAARAFTVDPVKNDTTIPGGTEDNRPATETPLPEPPAPEVPLTKTLETAQAAAELYFPDAMDMDVPASCGGTTTVDCPGGIPLPPVDQLSVTSTRSVLEVAGQSRYDVTVTSGVETLQVVKVGIPGGDCDMTLTSANGANPNWTIHLSLLFLTDASGEYRIEPQNTVLTGEDAADFNLSGGIACALANLGLGFYSDFYLMPLEAHFAQVGRALCAAPGPAYLGPCPPTQ
jgi:hypothetical protein